MQVSGDLGSESISDIGELVWQGFSGGVIRRHVITSRNRVQEIRGLVIAILKAFKELSDDEITYKRSSPTGLDLRRALLYDVPRRSP